jgi:uncharacterized coiled-coil protein SlyX
MTMAIRMNTVTLNHLKLNRAQIHNKENGKALLAEKLKSERLSSQVGFQAQSLDRKATQLQKLEEKLQQSEKKHAAANHKKSEVSD